MMLPCRAFLRILISLKEQRQRERDRYKYIYIERECVGEKRETRQCEREDKINVKYTIQYTTQQRRREMDKNNTNGP